VHGVDDAEIGKRAMGELASHKCVRDDADGVTAGGENRIRDDAHQANSPAAEDEANAAASHLASQLTGDVRIDVPMPCARSAEHAHTA